MTRHQGGGENLPFHLRRRLGLLERAAEHELGTLARANLPAWLRPTEVEPRVTVTLAVLVAMALQVTLPPGLSLRPSWLLPAVELLLLVVLVAVNPVKQRVEHQLLRVLGVGLTAAISLGNGVSAVLLADALVNGSSATSDAKKLLLTGGSIYLTNVIAFGLWFWELDRGGPFARAHARHHHPDLLFPQMAMTEVSDTDWEPRFGDYLYVSFTNATAFSPTDTMPLARWAKLLMALQSGVALVTVALVIARAINILK